MDTLINSEPKLKCPINTNNHGKILPHNFELIINYISHCVLKNDNKFSNNDLLKLAKCIFTISSDHHYGKMLIVIKKLFCVCIETALHDNDEAAIIGFSQELYIRYPSDDLLMLIVNLFLPLEGHIMEKIYTYLTFKLFNSLLEKTNNINTYPSSVKDWQVICSLVLKI